VLFLNGGQNDAAINTLKKAFDLDPTLAEAQYQYAMALASKATTDASGKVIPPPGTLEALQKYLELKPDGSYAQTAKELICALGGDSNAPKGKPSARRSSR
jgi:hypothetical protein